LRIALPNPLSESIEKHGVGCALVYSVF